MGEYYFILMKGLEEVYTIIDNTLCFTVTGVLFPKEVKTNLSSHMTVMVQTKKKGETV